MLFVIPILTPSLPLRVLYELVMITRLRRNEIHTTGSDPLAPPLLLRNKELRLAIQITRRPYFTTFANTRMSSKAFYFQISDSPTHNNPPLTAHSRSGSITSLSKQPCIGGGFSSAGVRPAGEYGWEFGPLALAAATNTVGIS